MQDQLHHIALQLVEAKSPGLDEDLKQIFAREVATTIQDHISRELFNRLSDKQLDEFSKTINKTSSEQDVRAFFTSAGVDTEEAARVAIARFKQAYIGE